jgi:hypothetical protein
VALRRHAGYHGDKASVERLIFRVIPDNRLRRIKLTSGAIDAMDRVNPDEVDILERNPRLKVLRCPGLNVGYIAMNTRRPPFDRPLVRRAALGFLVFGVVFVILMSLPAKKFDRYILPAFPAFEVLSALGWMALAMWIGAWWLGVAAKSGACGTASARPRPSGGRRHLLFVGVVPCTASSRRSTTRIT